MSAPRLVFEKQGRIVRVLFDNPAAHNALTQEMWRDLRDAALAIAADPEISVVTFRGVGGKAFVSGADIAGFAAFATGEDGLAYERGIDECMGALDAIPVTTIAIVDGWCVGGGLNIASSCDFRIATAQARFGSPVGRTLGNCLSMNSYARIAAAVGVQIAKRMLLLGELVPAAELLDSGFLLKVVAPDAIGAEAETLCARAAENAPLTTRATKEAMRRLMFANTPGLDDLLARVYGSEDFREGVRNFLAGNKQLPDWRGE